ncbi:hypothetical protein [uncultured Muribaculum sp.]|uniref:hypothetical protein n=1 Tax=uncultured Muribaculum sp. TaxID=1918613 RepID=UPI0025EA2866|nr:hypothetical protein [uncultured Muribaculum sp.]
MRFLLLIFLLIPSLLPVVAEARELVDKLPARSYVIAGYDNPDSVRAEMRRRALHRIEGIWSFPSDGASIAIERHRDMSKPGGSDGVHYRMVVLRSPCRSLRPGTVMGYLSATAKPGIYAAEIYTAGDGGPVLRRPKRFTLTLVDDAHLTFRQHSRKLKVNLWRLIPYMSRISMRLSDSDAPTDLDGCTRVFPRPLSGPVEPRYL